MNLTPLDRSTIARRSLNYLALAWNHTKWDVKARAKKLSLVAAWT